MQSIQMNVFGNFILIKSKLKVTIWGVRYITNVNTDEKNQLKQADLLLVFCNKRQFPLGI